MAGEPQLSGRGLKITLLVRILLVLLPCSLSLIAQPKLELCNFTNVRVTVSGMQIVVAFDFGITNSGNNAFLFGTNLGAMFNFTLSDDRGRVLSEKFLSCPMAWENSLWPGIAARTRVDLARSQTPSAFVPFPGSNSTFRLVGTLNPYGPEWGDLLGNPRWPLGIVNPLGSGTVLTIRGFTASQGEVIPPTLPRREPEMALGSILGPHPALPPLPKAKTP